MHSRSKLQNEELRLTENRCVSRIKMQNIFLHFDIFLLCHPFVYNSYHHFIFFGNAIVMQGHSWVISVYFERQRKKESAKIMRICGMHCLSTA